MTSAGGDVGRARDDGWRGATLEVTTALLEGRPTDEVLRLVADSASRLVGGDVVTIGVPHIPAQSLTLRVAVGYRGSDLEGSVFPIDESLSGAVMASGEGLRVDDATASPNAYQPICELGDMGPTLIVPLTARNERFGTLLVARRRGAPLFTPDDLELLELFAGHVTLAIEHARTQDELQRLAVVEDRERIGRELHDTVIQQLFATGLTLQSAIQRCEGRAPEVADQLRDVTRTLDTVIADIRATIFDLAP